MEKKIKEAIINNLREYLDSAEFEKLIGSENDVLSLGVGDSVEFDLTNGERHTAIAIAEKNGGMLMVLKDIIGEQYYQYNSTDTNDGGWGASELREVANSEVLAIFPTDIRQRMIQFDNGDYLIPPTYDEVFADESYEYFHARENRIAKKCGKADWWWLRNKCASGFASVGYGGGADCYAPSVAGVGLRPLFILKNQ